MATTTAQPIEALAVFAQNWSVTIREKIDSFLARIPELETLTRQSDALCVQTKALKVMDGESFTEAAELARALGAVVNDFDTIIHPYTEMAHKLHKALVSAEKQYRGNAEGSRDALKRALGAYTLEQERIRREEERRLAEELRRQQDAEAQAEAERLAAEGDMAGAEAVIEQAVNTPPPVVVAPSTVPKVSGVVSRGTWKWRLKNKSRLKQEFLMPDDTAIGQVVRAMKSKAPTIVGEGSIEVYEDRSVAVRV